MMVIVLPRLVGEWLRSRDDPKVWLSSIYLREGNGILVWRSRFRSSTSARTALILALDAFIGPVAALGVEEPTPTKLF